MKFCHSIVAVMHRLLKWAEAVTFKITGNALSIDHSSWTANAVSDEILPRNQFVYIVFWTVYLYKTRKDVAREDIIFEWMDLSSIYIL